MNDVEREVEERAKCAAKRRHSDEAEARAHGMLVAERTEVIYVHRCPWCYGWHLTSNPQEGAAVTADNPYYEGSENA